MLKYYQRQPNNWLLRPVSCMPSNIAITAPSDVPDFAERALLDRLRQSAVGLHTTYTLASGETRRRLYLDTTATCLQLGLTRDVMAEFMPHYASTHTDVHFGARIANQEYRWAHQMVLDFCGADPAHYGSFFVGSGTTAGLNRIAMAMAAGRPGRDVVIATTMEHHSNDLPHRKHFTEVVHAPAIRTDLGSGSVDITAIEALLVEYGDRVNYVAVTGVSNVTGIINPIHDIAELAHRYDTLILVDGAQMAGHATIRMSGHDDPARNIDMLAMSGHKLYAPMSPGVVITRLDLFNQLEPVQVGGGMVDDVYLDRAITTATFPDREEAGTPNIAGAIALGAVLYALKRIGMDLIYRQEAGLLNAATAGLHALPEVIVYGSTDTRRFPRTGAISFNVRGMHHALLAAILNDYFNIAVRNGCFCAHPYVREMVSDDMMKQLDGGLEDMTNEQLDALADLHRGMVRASFGIYNDEADVVTLCEALRNIVKEREQYESEYEYLGDDVFRHRSFTFDQARVFNTRSAVDKWFSGGGHS